MSYFPPDPGKKARVFYFSAKQGGYVALSDAVVQNLPDDWFNYDEKPETLCLKRLDMSDEKFNALPVVTEAMIETRRSVLARRFQGK